MELFFDIALIFVNDQIDVKIFRARCQPEIQMSGYRKAFRFIEIQNIGNNNLLVQALE